MAPIEYVSTPPPIRMSGSVVSKSTVSRREAATWRRKLRVESFALKRREKKVVRKSSHTDLFAVIRNEDCGSTSIESMR